MTINDTKLSTAAAAARAAAFVICAHERVQIQIRVSSGSKLLLPSESCEAEAVLDFLFLDMVGWLLGILPSFSSETFIKRGFGVLKMLLFSWKRALKSAKSLVSNARCQIFCMKFGYLEREPI